MMKRIEIVREKNMSDRLLVIGLDGINFELLNLLIGDNITPTLNKLIKEGVSGDLKSIFPLFSRLKCTIKQKNYLEWPHAAGSH